MYYLLNKTNVTFIFNACFLWTDIKFIILFYESTEPCIKSKIWKQSVVLDCIVPYLCHLSYFTYALKASKMNITTKVSKVKFTDKFELRRGRILQRNFEMQFLGLYFAEMTRQNSRLVMPPSEIV